MKTLFQDSTFNTSLHFTVFVILLVENTDPAFKQVQERRKSLGFGHNILDILHENPTNSVEMQQVLDYFEHNLPEILTPLDISPLEYLDVK